MTCLADRFASAFAACPLVAILRGITPQEARAVGDVLADAGFTLIEVPLNSPDPYESIRLLSQSLSGRAMIGAGTVLTSDEVRCVSQAGGVLSVSPNVDPATIGAAVEAGMISIPGYFTASEAFAALSAGASALKLFPADGAAPEMLRAQRAVLPSSTKILAVGGVHAGNMADWRQAGADGFGLGSNLYRPGKSLPDIARDAQILVRKAKDIP